MKKIKFLISFIFFFQIFSTYSIAQSPGKEIYFELPKLVKSGTPIKSAPSKYTLGEYFTISVWLKPHFSSSNSEVIKSGIVDIQLTPGDQSRVYLRWEGPKDGFMLDSRMDFAYTTKPNFEANQWHHLAVTRSPGQVDFYWNGKLSETLKVVDLLSVNNVFNMPIYVGTGITPEATTFDGDIYDVKIYNSVLSNSEIKTLALKRPSRLLLKIFELPEQNTSFVVWIILFMSLSTLIIFSSALTSTRRSP